MSIIHIKLKVRIILYNTLSEWKSIADSWYILFDKYIFYKIDYLIIQ